LSVTKRTDRTTFSIPADLRRRARIKAITLESNLSAVVRDLLERWVAGEIKTRQEEKGENRQN
jgi:hypothetical protein